MFSTDVKRERNQKKTNVRTVQLEEQILVRVEENATNTTGHIKYDQNHCLVN